MRWTVGSSMYSKARLPGTLARSTLRLTCTGPAPVTDGGEKHTISDEVLLVGDIRTVILPVHLIVIVTFCSNAFSSHHEPFTLTSL